MKFGVLLSRVRVEEKWLLEALEKRGVSYDRIVTGSWILILTILPGGWNTA